MTSITMYNEPRLSLADRVVIWFWPNEEPLSPEAVKQVADAISEAGLLPVERIKLARQRLIDDEKAEIAAREARITSRNEVAAQAKLVYEASCERIAAENEVDRAAIRQHADAIAELMNEAPRKKARAA